jgi:hypothetical protein
VVVRCKEATGEKFNKSACFFLCSQEFSTSSYNGKVKMSIFLMYCPNKKRQRNKQAVIYFSELREMKADDVGYRHILFLG